LLAVGPSPHLARSDDTQRIMLSVVIALVPAIAASIVFFGFDSIRVLALTIAACVVFEKVFLKLFKNEGRIDDWSAVVTGILLAFNLPASSPWWLILTGSLVAMLLGKHIYGGLGHNPFNPALIARIFLLISWPTCMTSFPKTRFMADGISSATPLGILKTDGLAKLQASLGGSPFNLALGNVPGSLGEISALAIFIGALYLFYKGYIRWHIPAAFIGTVFAFTGIFYLAQPETYASPVFHVFAGGLFLGAFFMATDMVTTPITSAGMLLFGFGCGLITSVIRLWGGYPEGVAFSILIMNAFTPLIDRYVKPARFGKIKSRKP